MKQTGSFSADNVFRYSPTTLIIACILVATVIYLVYRSLCMGMTEQHLDKLQLEFEQLIASEMQNRNLDVAPNTSTKLLKSIGFDDLLLINNKGKTLLELGDKGLSYARPKIDLNLFKQALNADAGLKFHQTTPERLLNRLKPSAKIPNAALSYYIPIAVTDGGKSVAVASAPSSEFADIIDSIALYFAALGAAIIILISTVYFWVYSNAKLIIDRQNSKLQSQIQKLRNTVAVNQGMQKNMRSASSRAVELNEKFLRRVGADLHDGPAQTIGYAILRLDSVNQESQSKRFNQEYHTVKDALTNTLNEIRAISSGLVLPELEGLTLEQTIEKVVELHEKNTGMRVKTYYKDIPERIPFPIMICTYRFIQEALNNAHRHGNADECRIIVNQERRNLMIMLKDNGRGFRAKKQESDRIKLGLAGLVDRIESIGGQLDIISQPSSGVTIKVSLPIYSQ